MSTVSAADAAGALSRTFVADMEALPAGVWEQPSDCEGWTVAGAFIHVCQVAELLGDSIARGADGDDGPPALAAREGVQAWRARRAEVLEAALDRAPAELLEWYRRAVAALSEGLDRAAAAPPEARGWHPIGPRPLAWLVDQWLFELALHDWDIRVALDPAAEVRPAVRDAFGRTLPARVGRGFSRADDPALAGRYRILLAGDEPHGFLLVVGNGSVEDRPDDGAPADATIRTDPHAFAMVVTNRRPIDAFEGTDRWRVEGDAEKARAFARAFKGY
jgi:uncharacterized protein (TIGR03083 family)